MGVQTKTCIDLAGEAYDGTYKLPAFQREWKWKRSQVAQLFDSLRRDYPIGGFLLAPAKMDIDLDPRPFQFADGKAAKKETALLVMDGQQRLTACIQLFFDLAVGQKEGTHYFLDLRVIEAEFANFAKERHKKPEEMLDDDDSVRAFVDELDIEKRYLRGVNRVKDPWSRLVSQHQVFTPLLLQQNTKRREVEFDKYYEAYPEKKTFIRNVILSHFVLGKGPDVPCIIIDKKDVEALSRIFSTLNNTGKLLTPFELVVATLFPKQIDLRKGISDAKEQFPEFYPNMDPTGEIALQTCVLLDGQDPKKSRLPKTLTAKRWQDHREEAFSALNAVGKWLTERLGFALDLTGKYVPYDSIFAPLAYVFANVDFEALNPLGRKKAFTRLERYVVGASLSQRYQEGVHNKQALDAKQLRQWVMAPDDRQRPAWLDEVVVPALTSADPNGAIGKTLLCLMNRRKLKDPITGEDVGLGDSRGQDHHIFPTRFAPKLKGWIVATDKADRILNIMRVEKKTNADFLNDDPVKQIERADAAHEKTVGGLVTCYADHWIDERCLKVLRRPEKTRKDYLDFLKERQRLVQAGICDQFGFPIAAAGDAEETDDDDS